MNQDERDMLIRIDERVQLMCDRHRLCDIPSRVKLLESKNTRIEAMVVVILALVSLGRVWDLYEFFRQWILNI
jgi:hypothetical protein